LLAVFKFIGSIPARRVIALNQNKTTLNFGGGFVSLAEPERKIGEIKRASFWNRSFSSSRLSFFS
jgi:hypothetical protein